MKNKILFVFIMVAFASNIKAQEKVNFGLKGGINFSYLSNNNNSYKKSKTGVNFGLLAEIQFTDKFSIQPEILYSTQGVKTDVYLVGTFYSLSHVKGEYIFNYIQTPILIKAYIFKNLSIEAGPSFNIITKSEQKSKYQKLTKIGNNFEISGVLGLSYKLNKSIFISSRFFKGFSNVFQYDAINFENAKNYGLQFDIGLLF